jgi:hypothetical protein
MMTFIEWFEMLFFFAGSALFLILRCTCVVFSAALESYSPVLSTLLCIENSSSMLGAGLNDIPKKSVLQYHA